MLLSHYTRVTQGLLSNHNRRTNVTPISAFAGISPYFDLTMMLLRAYTHFTMSCTTSNPTFTMMVLQSYSHLTQRLRWGYNHFKVTLRPLWASSTLTLKLLPIYSKDPPALLWASPTLPPYYDVTPRLLQGYSQFTSEFPSYSCFTPWALFPYYKVTPPHILPYSALIASNLLQLYSELPIWPYYDVTMLLLRCYSWLPHRFHSCFTPLYVLLHRGYSKVTPTLLLLPITLQP